MKPSIPDIVPLVKALYAKKSGATGCCLHLVLDDSNVNDADVKFCLKTAHENGHADCAELAELLLRMSRTQRLKLRKAAL